MRARLCEGRGRTFKSCQVHQIIAGSFNTLLPRPLLKGGKHMQTYTQCRLRRGRTEQIAWIPSEIAKKNQFLRIKSEDGWRVIGVGATMPESYVMIRHKRDYGAAFHIIDMHA